MWLDYEAVETLLVFVGLFFISYVYYRRTLPPEYDQSPRPPTLKSLPVVGSFPFLPQPEKLHIWFLDKLTTMGGVIGFYVRSKYVVILQTHEAINEAYIKQSSRYASRPVLYVNSLMNPRNSGIVERSLDAGFKKYHKLTLNILREFGFGVHGVMETRIHQEVADLVAELKQLKHSSGSVSMYPLVLVNGSVINVIANILFGKRFDRTDPELGRLLSLVNRFVHDGIDLIAVNFFPLLRFLPFVRRRMTNFARISDSLNDFLHHKIEESKNDAGGEASFIRSFIEVEGGVGRYDEEELLFIVRDMVIAGSETSSTTIMWAIALLAGRPQIQQRLHDELDSVIEAGRLPSLADRPRLPYVEATILELMRYKTIIPMALPRETTGDTEVDGFRIPSGTMVMPNLHAVHMDPVVWTDPTTFRPERFLDESSNIVNRDKVIPFSVGKRSCLGELLARQEIYIFVAGLLQNFDIRPPDGQAFADCHEVVGLFVAPSPFKVCFVSRNSL